MTKYLTAPNKAPANLSSHPNASEKSGDDYTCDKPAQRTYLTDNPFDKSVQKTYNGDQ